MKYVKVIQNDRMKTENDVTRLICPARYNIKSKMKKAKDSKTAIDGMTNENTRAETCIAT